MRFNRGFILDEIKGIFSRLSCKIITFLSQTEGVNVSCVSTETEEQKSRGQEGRLLSSPTSINLSQNDTQSFCSAESNGGGKNFGLSMRKSEIQEGANSLCASTKMALSPYRPIALSPIRKKAAFTLAEVLIALGIIGVVAAVTLPSFIQKKYEKETVAKVKKAYSELSQAYLMARNEFGTFDEWGITTNMSNAQSHITFANNMKKYMKISKDCVGMSNANTNKYCTINGLNANGNSYARVKLNNGSILAFRMYHNDCSSNYGGGLLRKTCGVITLYTNPKQKKQCGKNAFDFIMTKEGIVPAGTQDAVHQFNKACNPKIEKPYPGYSSENMYACTAWVIYNENMDYWHCDGLDWNIKTKCKY